MSTTKKPLKRTYYNSFHLLQYELVLVFDAAKSSFHDSMKVTLLESAKLVMERNDCLLTAVEYSTLFVRLRLTIHPAISVSTLINTLKTQTSRSINKQSPFAWKHGYIIRSLGAPLSDDEVTAHMKKIFSKDM